MSKHSYLKEILREAYPIYNKEIVEKVMKRIEKIEANKGKKQPS
tara:strand:- start:383 stop:514 length:132 start_codon:yes stop_codon:yes gene_type:complete